VDRTTPFTDPERRQIRQSFEAIRGGLRTGDRLQMGSIEDLFVNSFTKELGCLPKCPPNDGNCSPGVALIDESAFDADLETAIEQLLEDRPEQPKSDVTATIAGAAAGFSTERPVSDLYVFSDMIENSQHMPSERLFALPVPEALAAIRSAGAMAAMSGARVHIIGMGRGHATGRAPITGEQMIHLRSFWNAYFTEATGAPPTFESVVTR
jgi:hypothetical protein